MNINPFELMRNAKELQARVGELQEEMETVQVQGSSGGGLVKVILNGKFRMVKLELDPIVVDNRDVAMLQDLIRSAHTDAIDKMKDILKEKLGPLAALGEGLPL